MIKQMNDKFAFGIQIDPQISRMGIAVNEPVQEYHFRKELGDFLRYFHFVRLQLRLRVLGEITNVFTLAVFHGQHP